MIAVLPSNFFDMASQSGELVSKRSFKIFILSSLVHLTAAFLVGEPADLVLDGEAGGVEG